MSNIIETINSLDKRIMHLEASFKKVELETKMSDEKLNETETKCKHALDVLNKRTRNVKHNLNKINHKINKNISILKHLSHKSDLNNLREKLKHMKLDQLITHKDIHDMVTTKLKN